MNITTDPTFSYIMHDYGGGNVTYAHSAPRIGINTPVQEYWIAKAMGDDPLHFGGVVYATRPRAPATQHREEHIMIRIPRRFYDDHVERDLEAPAVLKATKAHYWIDAQSPHIDELLSDADYYADSASDMDSHLFGLCASARATARAIRAAA